MTPLIIQRKNDIISKTIIVMHKHFPVPFLVVFILLLHLKNIKIKINKMFRIISENIIKKNIFPDNFISFHGISTIAHTKTPISIIFDINDVISMHLGR